MVKCSFLTLSIWMRYWGENLTACVWPGDRQSPWHYTMGILTNCKQILIISAFALWKMMLIVKHRRGSQGQSSKWLHVGSLLKEFWEILWGWLGTIMLRSRFLVRFQFQCPSREMNCIKCMIFLINLLIHRLIRANIFNWLSLNNTCITMFLVELNKSRFLLLSKISQTLF